MSSTYALLVIYKTKATFLYKLYQKCSFQLGADSRNRTDDLILTNNQVISGFFA